MNLMCKSSGYPKVTIFILTLCKEDFETGGVTLFYHGNEDVLYSMVRTPSVVSVENSDSRNCSLELSKPHLYPTYSPLPL